ncbi:MAG: InlB B-repeat-containing protein [Clostridia bacterium]|nr:InlB B-repeat-containing protein [Clostridia bacterium]
MKNGILKKSLSVFLALLMIVPTLFATGAAPLLSLFDGVVTEAEAAIAGIRIVVPETLYLTPSTGASTSVQYYINNNADGSVKTTTDTTASVHISYPGAKLTSISAATSAAITLPSSITGLVGTTFGSSAATATGTFSLPAGLNPGGTALVEWTFVFDVNGQTKTHYAYTVAYAPWYQPVGAAAKAVGSWHNTYASSILWVQGVHGYSDGDRANSWYVQTANFLPMLGNLKAPSNNNPDTNWIQSGSNGLSPTMSYNVITESGTNYHARANTISPTANITVDTSRYNNFNQIPNFSVGFMVTDKDGIKNGTNAWYVSDYGTSNGSSYYNGTDRGSSQYTSDWNDTGTKIWYSDSDNACGIKVNQQSWNKGISGTADFRLKSAARSEYKATITTTGWNNNFVNISVTGADKSTLRTNVLNGTSYAKENYTADTWIAYYSALKTAATNLCNPTSATVDSSALTTAEAGLHTTLTLNANGGNLGENVPLSVAMQVGGNPTTSFNNADVIGAYYATRTGYTFLGWSTDKNATSAPATVTVGLNDTVYAVWKANTYYAIFDNLIDYNAWNKAAGNGVVSDVTADGFTITSNDGAGEATSESPYFAVTPGKSYKIEMDFIGDNWDVYIFFCDENGSWIDFADGPSNRYSSNGSTGVPADNAVFTAPSKTEVVKAKIRVDANGSNNAVRFENIRVYEVGKVAEGVSYETAKLVTYDSPYGTLPTPVKTGYTFDGWLRHDDTYITEASVMKITENSYLTSQWTENRYTVAYNANGSNDAVEAPKTYNYTENVTVAAAIERVGHTFAGWKSDANGEIYQPGEEVPALTAENDVTVTLTAQWNINSYTLTFVNNAGSTVESKAYDYGTAGSDVTLPANTAAHYDGTNHYSYAWPTVADVTDNAIYNETKKTEAHVFTETVIADSTCTATGTKKLTCACGYETTEEIPMKAHSLAFVAKVDAKCGIEGTGEHYKCSVCGGLFADENGSTPVTAEQLVIPALEHQYGEVKHAATCTMGSYSTFTCALCNDTYSTDPADDLIEHPYVLTENNPEPDCTNAGVAHYTCSACGATKTENLEALGHSMQFIAGTPATCTSAGTIDHFKCTRCSGLFADADGENALDSIVDPIKDHTPGEAAKENVVPATCTVAGSHEDVVKCTVCSTELSRTPVVDPVIAHTAAAAVEEGRVPSTCTVAGYYYNVVKCSVCSTELDRTKVDLDLAAHTEEILPATDSTCTVPGKTEGKKCSVCDAILVEQQDTELKAHTEAAAVEEGRVESTCTVAGSYDSVVYCSVCNTKLSSTKIDLPLAAHAEEILPATDSTCTVAGKTEGKKCSVCGEILVEQTDKALAPHNEATREDVTLEATCGAPGSKNIITYCTVCNADLNTVTEVIPATGAHVYANEVAGTRVDATCVATGKVTFACACGATEEQTLAIDSTNHANLVTDTAVAATCTATGLTEGQHCEACKVVTVAQQTTDKLAHTEDTREEVTSEATCGAEGKKNVITYCTVCKNDLKTVEETIPATGKHSYDGGVITTEPKCETDGVKTFTCSVCNDSYTEAVAQLGHKYVGVETKAPTCTETGIMTYTCQNDSSHTYTEEIKENGHTITKVEAKAATCDDFGWNAYEYCSVCDYTTYEEIDALGHDYEGAETKAPTCTEKGVMTYTCKNDASHTYTEDIAALNHIDDDNNGYCDREGCDALICDHVGTERITTDEAAATCTADGYTGDVRCTKCDVIVEYGTKINMLGHAWSETFTSNGDGKDNTHYQTCTRENCGVKNEAVAHTWNEGAITTDPTCEGEGVKTFTCTASECGATYTEAVVANGHDYGTWIAEVPATCIKEGVKGHYV